MLALHIPSQIQLHASLGFPNPIPAQPDNNSLVRLGHLLLLPLLVHFWFMSEFSLEILVHPCRHPSAFYLDFLFVGTGLVLGGRDL